MDKKDKYQRFFREKLHLHFEDRLDILQKKTEKDLNLLDRMKFSFCENEDYCKYKPNRSKGLTNYSSREIDDSEKTF